MEVTQKQQLMMGESVFSEEVEDKTDSVNTSQPRELVGSFRGKDML